MKILLVSSVLLLAVRAPALAGSPPAATPAPPAFGEAVDVNVVNVDVYATDRQGHRITNLGKDDFELLEDGKRVPVSNFERVEAEASRTGAAAAGGAPAQASPAAAGKAPDEALNLVVYLDDFNIRPAHRTRVLKQLEDFLAHQLAPGDRVMLVTYDLGLNVRVPFTSDPQVLAKGLREIGALTAHGDEDLRDRQDAFKTTMVIQTTSLSDPTDPIPCPLNIVEPARTYARFRRQEVLRTLSGLTVMVNSLSGVPGRKALLHVSDGIPLNPGEEMFQFLLELCGGQGASGFGLAEQSPSGPHGRFSHDSSEDFAVYDARSFGPKAYQAASQAMLDAQGYSVAKNLETLAAHANAQRVTLYTLQASGLQGPDAADASAGPEDRLFQFPSIGRSIRMNNRDSLQLLADGTGGRSILDANDILPDLARMREDRGGFYSLAFTPGHSGDGREHKIEVRVRRAGLSLRYRQSYRDKPAIERVVDRTLAALFYGFEENPLGVTVEVGEPVAAEGGEYSVPLRLRIPLFKLALLSGEDAYTGKLRVLVATRDDGGGTSAVHQVPVPLQIPRKQVLSALGQYYLYTLTVRMKPGTQHFAVAVQDELAASTSYLSRPVTVAATATTSYP